MKTEHDRIKTLKPAISTVYLRWRRICGEPAPGLQLASRYSQPKARSFFRRLHGS